MKVLMFNGSARPHGCTFTALSEIGRQLEKEGIDSQIIQIGGQPMQGVFQSQRTVRLQ